MSGIRGLRVNINKYSGEINIFSDQPQIHMILSADTQFLDGAFSALEQNPGYFTVDGKPLQSNQVRFLRKQDSLIDGLTVAENVFLPNKRGVFLTKRRMTEACERLFEEIGYYLQPSALVSELTGSQRRFVEFYQAYLCCPTVLAANEVTSILSYKEISYFSRMIEALKQRGTHTYFFTTRYEEALRIGDVFHVFVDGEQQCCLPNEEVQANPEKLFLSMMNIPLSESNEGDNERQWLRAINDSLQLDNQFTRVNMVLSAYCARIRKLLNGQFCRLYICREREGEITCASSSDEGGHQDFGYLKDEELRNIAAGAQLFFATERDHDYAALFDSPNFPRGTMCYSMNAVAGSRMVIQVGMSSPPKYISSDKMDQIQHVAIELLIFIENSQLHRQTAILQESNHRIKNNMQMILSYLMLQQQSLLKNMQDEVDCRYVDQAFSDLTNRIMAVYRVHNLISDMGTQARTVSFQELLEETKRIYESHLVVMLTAEETDISQKQLLPLCIILNELMNNTVKHNAQLGRLLHAEVRVFKRSNDMHISYHDDGMGYGGKTSTPSSGIGLRLIRMLVQNDLKGELDIEAENGYMVHIRFPLASLDKE